MLSGLGTYIFGNQEGTPLESTPKSSRKNNNMSQIPGSISYTERKGRTRVQFNNPSSER